jgi:hypothetical protein
MELTVKEITEEPTRLIERPDHTSQDSKENPTANLPTDNTRPCDAPDRASFVGQREYDLDGRSSKSPSASSLSLLPGMPAQHFPRNS